jgi:hypothetical protein
MTVLRVRFLNRLNHRLRVHSTRAAGPAAGGRSQTVEKWINSTDWMVDAMIDRDGYRPNVAIVLVNTRTRFSGQADQGARLAIPQGGIKPGRLPSRRCTGSSTRKRARAAARRDPRAHARLAALQRAHALGEARMARHLQGQKQIWFLLRLSGAIATSACARAATRIRCVALARLLVPARGGDRLQARGLSPRARASSPATSRSRQRAVGIVALWAPAQAEPRAARRVPRRCRPRSQPWPNTKP